VKNPVNRGRKFGFLQTITGFFTTPIIASDYWLRSE